MNSQLRYDAAPVQASLCERDRRVLARHGGRIPADPAPLVDRTSPVDPTSLAAHASAPRGLVAARPDMALWIALAALVLVWAGLDATLLANGLDLRLFALVNAGLAAAAVSQVVAIRRVRPPQARAEPRAGRTLRAA